MKRVMALMGIGWMILVLLGCGTQEQLAGGCGGVACGLETSPAEVAEQTSGQIQMASPFVPPEFTRAGTVGSENSVGGGQEKSEGLGASLIGTLETSAVVVNGSGAVESEEKSRTSEIPSGSGTEQDPAESPPGPTASDDPEAIKALLALEVSLERNDQGQVKSIVATQGQMTNQAMALLGRLPALEKIEIRGGNITSKGLVHLKDLQGLQRLYLCEVPLDDEALKHLAGLTKLIALSLEKTGITGKGLAYLKNLKNLEVLNLADNPIDDKAIGHLEALSRLDTITLRNTRVTGNALIHLKGLERLRVLNLIGCKEVTDQSLQHLRGLKELRMLYVRDTQVTNEGAQKLKKQIPGLAVFFH
ncbi:MAG: hypothetical protein NZ602_15055 [Thermoguttaceae bacterium]|nr:hypothetical protein [Thermoguttaceae bacterium]MDW8037520.1 hypothetical protein [Thermoguttaceae bacterium]